MYIQKYEHLLHGLSPPEEDPLAKIVGIGCSDERRNVLKEIGKGYGNIKAAKAAVSRALRQLEAQGLVKAETSKDRRIKIYSLRRF